MNNLFDPTDPVGFVLEVVEQDALTFTPRTDRSGHTNHLYRLDGWLKGRGYQVAPARSVFEYQRYRKGDRLIILYVATNAVLCQGADWQGAWQELQLLRGGAV